ncbi:endonuclease/exonuclease/phosphatase family protein [Candidatus Venteria ishoeyi]|uniref:Endonuclease/exonuclease/phosphatase domain-containing protein n=1 Tax=Candidatus Venteria ishoeyi TaxID=1899563 RepID=A0A1H6FG23_9GAMM|nr:Uncharacterised protein [Candidatus Venteria ishoeyi]
MEKKTSQVAEVIKFSLLSTPALSMSVKLQSQSFQLLVVHPVPPINLEMAALRDQQLQEIAWIVQHWQTPGMVLGDLNTALWSPAYLTLEQETGLYNARQGFGILPSWPAPFLPLGIPLDHCLLSPTFTVQNIALMPSIASDHQPLWIEVGLGRQTK